MFVLGDLQKKIKSSEPCSREDDIAKLENALDNDSLDDVNVDAEQNAIATELEEVRAALEQDGIEPDNLLSDFYSKLDSDVLHVTSIPAEELQEEENRRIQARVSARLRELK